MNNDFRAIIQIAYDMAKGNKQLQADIKKIQEQYKIKFKAELDEKSALNSIKQMEKYQDSFNKKNLNGIDLEIKKRQEQSQIFSNQIKSQMQERVSAEKKIQAELIQTAKEQQNAFKLDEGKAQTFNRIGSYISNNTKLTKEQVVGLKQLQNAISNVNDKSGLDQIKTKFRTLTSDANLLGNTGDTVFARLKKNSAQFLNYLGSATLIMGSIRAFQNIVDEVKNIDSAMISLKKVTNETHTTYESFLVNTAQKAKELGASISDLVNATADFARLGYNLPDAAKLGEVATLYKNVGDGIDIEGATQSIISTMKAFNIQAENSMSIIDKFNQVGNNFAISSAGIGDSLMRSASALMEANNTLDESIALTVAANNVVQDPEKVGNMWKTVAMRIRGAKTELEEAGLETEGMVESTSKLRDEIKSLTGGFDIMIDNNTFKSTYDIVLGISKVYDKMSDTSQANILEMLAGKRQGNALAAALNNAEDLQKALESSQQSFGSALDEQRKYEEGIQYSLDRLKASTQELSMTTLDSSIIKAFVDIANGAVNATTAVGGLVPVLSTLAVLYLSFNKNEKYAFLQNFISYLFKTKLTADATAVSIGGLTLSVKALTGIVTGGLLIAIPLIAKGLDAIITTLEEQKEALEAANTAYEDSKTELKNINSELDTTRKRIDELEAKDNLTFVEDGELQKLKDITAELLIQRDIQQRKKDEDAKILAETASDTFKKQFGKSNISESQVSDYINNSNVTGNNALLISDQNNISSMLAGYKQFIELQDEALGSGATEDYEHFKELTEGISKSLWDNVSVLQEQQSNMRDYYNSIKDTPYENLTSEQKEVYDNYNLINDAIELIYTNLDPSKLKEIKFTEVFNSSEMSDVKQKLEELVKVGELTPEVLSSNKEYQKLLDETGLTAEEVAKHINGLLETVESSGEQAETTIISLTNALSKMSNSGKTLQSLKDEFKELNYISTDTLNSLIDKYPQLEQAVANYVAGKITEKDLIAEMSKVYQTDYENYREAIIKKQELDEGFYKDVVANLPSWVKNLAGSYGIDFDNFKTLQESKLKVAKEYEKKLAEIQGLDRLYNSQIAFDPLGINKDAFGGMYSDAKSKLEQEAKDYQKILDGIDLSLNTTLDIDGYKSSSSPKDKKPKKDKKTDPIKDAFDLGTKDKKGNWITGKNDLDHKLAMDKMTIEEYYDGLEKINEATFGKNEKIKAKYLESYRQYVEEVHKGRKSLEFSETIDWASMSLQRLQDDVDIAQNKLDNTEGYQAQIDAINELIEAQEALKAGYQSSATLYKSQYDNVKGKGIDKYKTMIETGATFELVDITDKKLRESISNAVDYFNKWRDSLNKIDSTSKSISKNYQEINNVLDSTISDIENIQGRLANSIKKENQEQYDNRLKHLRKMRDLDVKYHNDKIALLEEEIKRIQGNTIPDKLGKLSKLQGNYQEWLSDDSTLGKAKQKELRDQIAELDKEIQIDKLEEKIKSERDIIEDINDKFDKAIDEDSENFDAWLKTYKDRMSDQKAYEKANALMLSGNQKEIERLIKTFDPVYSGIATLMGETAGSIIAKAVSEALSGLGLLKGNGGSSGSYGNGGSSGSYGSSGTTTSSYSDGTPVQLENKALSILGKAEKGTSTEGLSKLNQYAVNQGYDVLTKKEMVSLAQELGVKGINSVADVGTDADGRWNKNQILDALIDKGYITQYKIGGETRDDGIAYLHKNERVLTAEQTNAFNKLVYDYIPNIFDNMTKGSIIDKSTITNRNVTFNKELVSYKVNKIVNYTPFDAKNEQDNLNRMFTKSLQKSGINTKL